MLSQHICFSMAACLNKDEYSTNLFTPPEPFNQSIQLLLRYV